MQGRQQPGQEKRYFLEQEESTGYLPVFRNIRLKKNKNMIEIKIDCSIHWCTGCHTLSTTTWMSQCWCLTGKKNSSGIKWSLFNQVSHKRIVPDSWMSSTYYTRWMTLLRLDSGRKFNFWIILLSIYRFWYLKASTRAHKISMKKLSTENACAVAELSTLMVTWFVLAIQMNF